MRRRDKRSDPPETGDASHAFLPDETSGMALANVTALEERVARLEQQLLAQYSALASYATVAQQAVEVARAEARADLDRTRHTVLALVDQLRRETQQTDASGTVVDVGGAPTSGIDLIGARVDELASSLEAVVRQQRDLSASVAALLDQSMSDRAWLVGNGNGSVDSLSLSLR